MTSLLLVQPLCDLIKTADQTQPNAPLSWTPEALVTVESVKAMLILVPALANFYVSEKQGFTSAMLTQQQ